MKCLYDDADCSNNNKQHNNNKKQQNNYTPNNNYNPSNNNHENTPFSQDIFSSSHSSISFKPKISRPDTSSEHRQEKISETVYPIPDENFKNRNNNNNLKTTRFDFSNIHMPSPSPFTNHSATTEALSNVDGLSERLKSIINFSIIIAVAVVLIAIISSLSWVLYRYKKKEEGTYKLDAPDTTYAYCTGVSNHPLTCSTSSSSKNHNKHKDVKLKKSTSREWYV